MARIMRCRFGAAPALPVHRGAEADAITG